VRQIRTRWRRVKILLRADSGFARDSLMSWCEVNHVDFVFGLARNARLEAELASDLAAVETTGRATGKPARRFKEFWWATHDSPRRPPGRRSYAVGSAGLLAADGAGADRPFA